MKAYKIKTTKCAKNKVQVRFSDVPSEIICSKDGYLYLRHKDINIKCDSQRKATPFYDKFTPKSQVSHLFEYDKLYIRFAKDEDAIPSLTYVKPSYKLSFIHFHKAQNGSTICTELYLSDFEKEEEVVRTFNRSELEEFLYDMSNVKGKYIFDWVWGIIYSKSCNEEADIKEECIDLSEEGIIRIYNKKIIPIKAMEYNFYKNPECVKNHGLEEVYNIDQVESFNVTNYGMKQYYPIMIVVRDNEISAYEFELIYCNKDCFQIRSQKIKMEQNLINMLLSASDHME